MCKRPHLATSRSHLAESIHWIQTMGAVEVHSLGYYTVVFVSCDSVRVVDAKLTSSFETKDVFQEELFFTLGKVLAM